MTQKAPERIWAFNAKQTGYRFYANGPQPEFDNVEYVRADIAQAPAPVRVGKLAWLDFPDRGAKAQAWNEANYMIQKWSDGRWEISASYPGYSTFIYGTDRFYPTLEDAKAAAQADHSTRILAALEPDAAPVRARDVEIARLAREIGEIGRDLGWHRVYDRADAILAALEAPNAGVVAELVEALTLAANRLQRRAVDYPTGSLLFIETSEWAAEARAAIAKMTPALPGRNSTKG